MDTTSLTACSPFAGAKFRLNIQIKKSLLDAVLSMLWSSLRMESEKGKDSGGGCADEKNMQWKLLFLSSLTCLFDTKVCGVPHLKVAKL